MDVAYLTKTVAGQVMVSQLQTVLLDATVPVFIESDLKATFFDVADNIIVPPIPPVGLSGGWHIGLDDLENPESWGDDDHQVSVITNAPFNNLTSRPQALSDMWKIKLRFEPDPTTPTLRVHTFAVFQLFAGAW